MARSRFIYTLKEVASMIGENLELIEEGKRLFRHTLTGAMISIRRIRMDG